MQNGDGNPHAQVSRLSIDVSDGIRRERSPPVFVALVDKQYPRRPNSKIKKIIECFWGRMQARVSKPSLRSSACLR